jgi:signal transduction histidine kinase
VELRNERDEAHEASEMKSQMIANLSHEVRTPMTALLGFSEVLREEATGPEVQRFGRLIYKSSLRLQQTLESVLHFSRLEAGKEAMDWEPVVVAQEVRDTYNEQRSRAEAHDIDFELDLSMVSEGVACRTDPGAIQRILRNLTGNAIKYTPQGGRVILRCATGRGGILVEIEDTGIGMSRSFQQRMFDPFSQESEGHAREFEGVGLGLAIVQKLVELIGASLEVESTPGHGTRFAVFIPREGG